MENTRKCPNCTRTLTYSSQAHSRKAEKKNTVCISCTQVKYETSSEFSCTECNKQLLFKRARKIETTHKCRSCSSKKGKNNPMYGKPPVQGSGWGWSGWYKDWHFRSFLELSYMISILEKENLMWKSAETQEFAIPYINYDGTERTYFPDFLVQGTRLIEIKPKRLHGSVTVLLKKEAAITFCEQKGWTYELVEPEKLTEEEILNLYKNKDIKFSSQYEKKFKEKYGSQAHIKLGLEIS